MGLEFFDRTHHALMRRCSLQEVCLHGLIAGAHDNAIILAALRQLNGDEVLSLVRYLSKLTERLSGVYTIELKGLLGLLVLLITLQYCIFKICNIMYLFVIAFRQ